jgi:hypothetical protein
MEPQSSLQRSQEPDTGPYSQTRESNPHLIPYLLKIHFKLSSHLSLRLTNGPFPSGFQTKNLYAFLSVE